MQEDETSQVHTEIENLIFKLSSQPIQRWEEMEPILQDALSRVQSKPHLPMRVKIFSAPFTSEERVNTQRRHSKILSRLWFDCVVVWAFYWDVITHPFRPSRITADTKTGIVKVEGY